MNTRQEYLKQAREWAEEAARNLGAAREYQQHGWTNVVKQRLDMARDCIRIGNVRCEWVRELTA